MSSRATPEHAEVAIIGGGATGAMVAYHLLRQRPDLGPAGVLIFEPRALLGAGLAYGTDDPRHRINVPAAKMSIDTGAPGDFQDWLGGRDPERRDPAAFLPSGDVYPARAEFGRYLAARLRPFIDGGALHPVRGTVASIRRADGAWRIRTADGAEYRAIYAVLAVSHPPPALPAPLRPLAGDKRLIANPWATNAFAGIAPEATVAIIGTGLTMADVVASLDAAGHRGRIAALSRRGLRSRGHSPLPCEPSGDFSARPEQTALALLRRVRRELARSPDRPWHAVLDAARRQGRAIWSALPVEEQRRLIRHLRPFWDVHRFRIAPQVEHLLDERIAAGTLSIRAARIDSAHAGEGGIVLHLRGRGGAEETLTADIVVNTTGPDHAGILSRPGFLRDLSEQGLVRRDPSGLGLWTDETHHAIGENGPVPDLFIAGPLSRGTFGELMGLPEVTENAESVARILAKTVLPLERDDIRLEQSDV